MKRTARWPVATLLVSCLSVDLGMSALTAARLAAAEQPSPLPVAAAETHPPLPVEPSAPRGGLVNPQITKAAKVRRVAGEARQRTAAMNAAAQPPQAAQAWATRPAKAPAVYQAAPSTADERFESMRSSLADDEPESFGEVLPPSNAAVVAPPVARHRAPTTPTSPGMSAPRPTLAGRPRTQAQVDEGEPGVPMPMRLDSEADVPMGRIVPPTPRPLAESSPDNADELRPLQAPALNGPAEPLSHPVVNHHFHESAEESHEGPYEGDSHLSRENTVQASPAGELPPASESAADSEADGVSLRWITPRDVAVGEDARCELIVHNATHEAVQNVRVDASVPQNVRLKQSQPEAASESDGALSWELGSLGAGQSATIGLVISPVAEGELTPSATVTFARATTARIQIVRPEVHLTIDGPDDLVINEPANYQLRVQNVKQGRASQVVVDVTLEGDLSHPKGQQLRFAVGSLGAGESRTVQLPITCMGSQPSRIHAALSVAGQASEEVEKRLTCLKADLELLVEGPKLRYVDRPAIYLVKVRNSSRVPASNVQLLDTVSGGFRFLNATGGGEFDDQSRQVAWFVGDIGPGDEAQFELELMPIEAGEQRIGMTLSADGGVEAAAETLTRVETVSRVTLDVEETDDPVEVLGETTYEIRVTNRGSQPARQVQVAARHTDELEVLSAKGATPATAQRGQVVFDPLEELAPGKSEVYRVQVRCHRAGQATFRAYLQTVDHEKPVVEEEVTRIYAD